MNVFDFSEKKLLKHLHVSSEGSIEQGGSGLLQVSFSTARHLNFNLHSWFKVMDHP